ncbi:MAG: DegV family protein [Clostridia bacterium]|nr:DegV family protein [Clostridia bacterium]
MNDYIIFTDSACDLSPETLKEWGVRYESLTYTFNSSPRSYGNYELPFPEFYSRMRNGEVAKTAAINTETFLEAFEPHLKNGNDILYVGFSSGLSNTVNAGAKAAESLVAKYPERKIIVIDTLAASAGEGLLLYFAVEAKKNGASIEEAEKAVRDRILKLNHWFTVDDLVYLKRGGRVSATAAFFGGVLGIKPVLHVDDNGHLIPVTKVRGRKASLKALADKYTELAETPREGTVFISHGDCLDDAEYLADLIKSAHGVDVKIITYVGSVIGAHSGPGTMALFFVGKMR